MKAPLGIKLRLLGRFTVTVDGEPSTPVQIPSKKGRALLAFLAMYPEHCADREELATLLWGDRPDQQARLSLRQCILSLRTAISEAGDVLKLEGNTVTVKIHHMQVDTLDFGRLAQSAAGVDLERAAQLYRGEFLSDLRIEADVFANWMQAERARLTTLAARVFETWTEKLDNTGRGQQAIDAADRLVALDPMREDWQRHMLRVCARHQGRDAALVRAKALIALLEAELGVEPDPAMRVLISDIRSAARTFDIRFQNLAAQSQQVDKSPGSHRGRVEKSRPPGIRTSTASSSQESGNEPYHPRSDLLDARVRPGLKQDHE